MGQESEISPLLRIDSRRVRLNHYKGISVGGILKKGVFSILLRNVTVRIIRDIERLAARIVWYLRERVA